MIHRLVQGTHHFVRQSEHARQCGVIAAALDERWLGPLDRRAALLRATQHHDDGWDEWDNAPTLAEDGLPTPFMDLCGDEHQAIWRRSIFGALQAYGPEEAAIIGRHSLALHSGSEEDLAARRELVLALGRRAWPGLEDESVSRNIDRAFSVLYFTDVVSLIALAGWTKRFEVDLLDEAGTALKVAAWLDDAWTVRVAPWPFVLPALPHAGVSAVLIPEGERGHAAARLVDPTTPLQRLPIHILSGEE